MHLIHECNSNVLARKCITFSSSPNDMFRYNVVRIECTQGK